MQLKIIFFDLDKYIEDIIAETPTGGHWDREWWSSRYTDMQVEETRKKKVFCSNQKLDFSFQDLMLAVLEHYKDNEIAIFYLKQI